MRATGSCVPSRAVATSELVATQIAKSYGGGPGVVPAVRDISLEVRAGEFVAVMGPSGSGKSTLLHLLAGLEAPDAGDIVVAGCALSALTEDELAVFRRRHIGVVFQSFNLVPTLTAEENVALPLRLDGLASTIVHERVEAALASVAMTDRRTHAPDRLSGGEGQRIAIARALAIEPTIILADEPTGSLDSETAARVLEILRAQRRTIVMVTHDAQAAGYAHRVVRVVDGVVVDDGSSMNGVAGGMRCASVGS